MLFKGIIAYLALITSGAICTLPDAATSSFTTNPFTAIATFISRMRALRAGPDRRQNSATQVISKHKHLRERGSSSSFEFRVCMEMRNRKPIKTGYDVWEIKDMLEDDIRILCEALHTAQQESERLFGRIMNLGLPEKMKRMESLLQERIDLLEHSELIKDKEPEEVNLDDFSGDYEDIQRRKREIREKIDSLDQKMKPIYECYAKGNGVLYGWSGLTENLQKCRNEGLEMIGNIRGERNWYAKELRKMDQVSASKFSFPKTVKESPTDFVSTAEQGNNVEILGWEVSGIMREYVVENRWSHGTREGIEWTSFTAFDKTRARRVFIKQYINEACDSPVIFNEELILRELSEGVEIAQVHADCFIVRKWEKNVETLASYLKRNILTMSDAVVLELIRDVFTAMESVHQRRVFLVNTQLNNILIGISSRGRTIGFLDYSQSIYNSIELRIRNNDPRFYSKVTDYQVFLYSLKEILPKPDSYPGISEDLVGTLNYWSTRLFYALQYEKHIGNVFQENSWLKELNDGLGL